MLAGCSGRQTSTALVAAALWLTASASACAQTFPSRPVNVWVAFPAGAAGDLYIRQLADIAGHHLGQPVIVDNKPGAGSAVATGTMASIVKPDGNTVAQAPLAALRLPLMQKTTWDPLKDSEYVIHLSGYILLTATRSDSPFKTWADVVAYATANPGKLTYGSSAQDGTPDVGMEMISRHAGIKFRHVPFNGGPDLNAALA